MLPAVHENRIDTGSTLGGYKLTAKNARDLVLIQQNGSAGTIRLGPGGRLSRQFQSDQSSRGRYGD
jgi:hypothetical protein